MSFRHALAATFALACLTARLVQAQSCSAPDFGAATDFTVGTQPLQVATGDFNRDGKTDLVVTNGGSTFVSVLQGTGAGGFAPAGSVAAGPFPSFGLVGRQLSVGFNPEDGMAGGDFNGDGITDIALANGFSVAVMLGTGGKGAFLPPTNFNLGGGAVA